MKKIILVFFIYSFSFSQQKLTVEKSFIENGRFFSIINLDGKEYKVLGGTINGIKQIIVGEYNLTDGDIGNFEIDNFRLKKSNGYNLKPVGVISSPTQSFSFSPSFGSAGTHSVVTLTGQGFGIFPRVFFTAMTNNWIEAAQKVTTDTRIECEIPVGKVTGYFASAHTGKIYILKNNSEKLISDNVFTVNFGYAGFKWYEPKINYFVNYDAFPDAVQSAVNTWNKYMMLSQFVISRDSSKPSQYNFRNEISMGETFGAGGINYLYSDGIQLYESDIVLSNQYPFSTSADGKLDAESVLLHELGHSLTLLDLYGSGDEAKVMYGVMNVGELKRNLTQFDIAGAQYIYGKTTKVNSPLFEGIKTVNKEEKIRVYPNPFNPTTNIEILNSGEKDLKIYNIEGKQIQKIDLKIGFNFIQLNFSNLPNGIYFVRLGNFSKKIMYVR